MVTSSKHAFLIPWPPPETRPIAPLQPPSGL